MKITKAILCSVSILLFLAFQGSQASRADDVKIGFVDMQKSLQSVEAGRKAKTQLEKEFNNKKKDVDTEETSIRKAGEEFKKQSLVMTDEARAKKAQELQERVVKWQELKAKSQMEIQQKEQELTRPIVEKLRAIISDVAKKKGYTVVLERNENTVLFYQDKDDVTGEVIEKYNKDNTKS